ncbi:MAG TPA: hypothetical protein DEF45_07265 [Rhodopirellula sp.]|nr:hypothetical protein [Rhodopirellula sp.]
MTLHHSSHRVIMNSNDHAMLMGSHPSIRVLQAFAFSFNSSPRFQKTLHLGGNPTNVAAIIN